MPTKAQLETGLRNAVRAHYKDGDEPPTVNGIRAKAEEDLGLEAGFFKNAEWKSHSKEIIQDQVDKNEEVGPEAEKEEEKKSLKRASPIVDRRPTKKSKLETEEDESTAVSDPPDSDVEEEAVKPKKTKKPVKKSSKPSKPIKPPAPKKPQAKAKKREDSSELSDASPQDAAGSDNEAKPALADNDDTSSELSSVMDDPDPPRKKSKANNGDTKSATKTSKAKPSKSAAEPDPNSEEIKRLQGWLVKCGIRKVWGKELKPYETSKAKIAHLKSLLEDAGMKPRYSNEKAAQIKESRELAADIEAVQEGNERWGKAGEDEASEDKDARGGRKRLIRGSQNFDFLDSDDGEETD